MNTSHPSITLSKAATVAAGVAMLAGLLSGCSTLADLKTGIQGQTAAEKDAPAVVAQPVKPEPLPAPEPAKKTKLYEWTGAGRAVTRVVVNVDEQKAHFYEGDKEVGWTTVASGVSKYPTPVGRFSVQEKVANKESNLYGKIYGKGGQLISSNAKMGRTPIPDGARFDGADMPYFLRLTGDGIGMHAGPIPRPGRPASHGCIRMPKAFAPIAFRHVGVGTQVSIVGKGPSYSAYLAQQRASAPRPKPAAKVPAQPPVGSPETVAQAATGAQAADGVAPGATSAALAAPQGGPAPEQPTTPATTAATDAPKVPAVAHNPEPPVAPAIATRTEPTQTPVAAVPNAAQGSPQVQGQVPAPAVAQTPVSVVAPGATHVETGQVPGAKPVSAPVSVAPTANTPAAPPTVYYPTPQAPAYRAPVQAPAFVPPQAASVAAQGAAPAQTAGTAQSKGPEQPVAAATAQIAEPKAAEPKASGQPAAVQPKAPEQPSAAAQPAAPAQPAATQTQGAG